LNESIRLNPDAAMLYACDAKWWEKTEFDWRAFTGVRISACPGPHIEQGVDRVAVSGNEMRFDVPGVLGGGGNSGFQSLNLLAQMSVARIAMIGLDMCAKDARHWHGRGWPWSPPGRRLCDRALDRWRIQLDRQAPALAARSVDVTNCSEISALQAFKRAPLNEVVQEWLT
jgi:hypothetical protein